MKWSCHNSGTSYFAESHWSKLSLLRDTDHESTKHGIRIGVMHSTAGTRRFVILSNRPLVVTTTFPQVKISVTQTSVTSLKSQGPDEHV
jgi:hypothetical protein